ncbi:hydrogenase maturation protease [Clostridium sp.]|jgi:hydrogenase maturation protease|uniref:hydrogenase maturation protease n=1 Tax=Clostridium sp. TaxID=1506 RepID=UPI002FDDE949
MKVKVMAIGNILMEDDGVAIVVLEKITQNLTKNNIEVIIGETDFEYCISLIEEEDFIFFIDAAYYGKNPGELTINSLAKYQYRKKYCTQHSYNVIDLIKSYYKTVNGYIIGIEVGKVSFKFGLSKEIQENINIISKNVFKEIISRLPCEI